MLFVEYVDQKDSGNAIGGFSIAKFIQTVYEKKATVSVEMYEQL